MMTMMHNLTYPFLAGYNAVLKEIALAFVRVVNEKRATLFRNRGEGANECIRLRDAAVQKLAPHKRSIYVIRYTLPS